GGHDHRMFQPDPADNRHWGTTSLGGPLLFLHAVLPAEPLHPAARGDDPLLPLARVEGVALGADLYPQVLHRGTCLEAFAARARDRGAVVGGMDARFHHSFTSPYALR